MSTTQSQTQNSSVDPGTRAYIEAYRQRAQNQGGYQQGLGGVDQYMNPYRNEVIGQIQAEGNRQAGFANQQAGDQATRAGAYGGSREAVLRGQMMGDVQRQTGQNVAQYSDQGYQNAVQQYMNDKQFGANNAINQLNAMTPGFQPTSQSNTMTQRSSLFPQILGLGATIGGALIGRPPSGSSLGPQMGGGGQGLTQNFPNTYDRMQYSTPYMNQQQGGLNFGNQPSRSQRYW